MEEKKPRLADLELTKETRQVLDEYFTQQLIAQARLGTLGKITGISESMIREISEAAMRIAAQGAGGTPALDPHVQDLLKAVARRAGSRIDLRFGELTPVMNTLLLEAIQELQPREAVLIRMRYGLGGEKCTISECARRGLVRGNCNRLQTIEENALQRIVQYMLPRFALMTFDDLGALHLNYLGLQRPVENALLRDCRFTTISDIAQTYDYVVRDVRNIGQKRIANVRQQLQVLGLEMKR